MHPNKWRVGLEEEAPPISIFIFISTERRFLAPANSVPLPTRSLHNYAYVSQKGIGALNMGMEMEMAMDVDGGWRMEETSPLGHGSRRGCRLAGAI